MIAITSKAFLSNTKTSEKSTYLSEKNMKIQKRFLDNDLTPLEVLTELANHWKFQANRREFALKLDECNLWPTYREKFEIPKLRRLPKGNEINF
jgi:hypothetical protein